MSIGSAQAWAGALRRRQRADAIALLMQSAFQHEVLTQLKLSCWCLECRGTWQEVTAKYSSNPAKFKNLNQLDKVIKHRADWGMTVEQSHT